MPAPRDYLRDRGLADGPTPPPQPPPFSVDLVTGAVVAAEPETVAVPTDYPFDYTARVQALDFACRFAGAEKVAQLARQFHAFLMDTTIQPAQQPTFTDTPSPPAGPEDAPYA